MQSGSNSDSEALDNTTWTRLRRHLRTEQMGHDLQFPHAEESAKRVALARKERRGSAFWNAQERVGRALATPVLCLGRTLAENPASMGPREARCRRRWTLTRDVARGFAPGGAVRQVSPGPNERLQAGLSRAGRGKHCLVRPLDHSLPSPTRS